jgi:HSP20 family protein
VRHRRISFRYTEVVGGLSAALEAELWARARPQGLASPMFRPPADVVESSAEFVVTIEVPGVAEDEVEIFVHPDALVVSGRRPCPDVGEAHWHVAEIRYGPFRFDMALPHDADAERIDASMERGLLRLVIPKRPGGAV